MTKTVSCSSNILPVSAFGALLAWGGSWDIEDYAVWGVREDVVVGVESDCEAKLHLVGI